MDKFDGPLGTNEFIMVFKSKCCFDIASDARYIKRTDRGVHFAKPQHHQYLDDYSL